MSFSISTASGNGSTVAYPVPFPYISQPHVIVSVDNQVVAYTFTSPSQITFSSPPASGALIVIRRRTPADELLAIVQGRSVLKTAELNLVYTQLLYIMQEAFDITDLLEDSTIEVAAALAAVQAALAAISSIASGIAYQYDCIVSVPYVPAAGDVVVSFPVVRSLSLPQDAPGSLANTLSAPAAGDVELEIRKNGVEIGTVTWAVAAESGVISVPATIAFAAGDILSVHCITPDSNFRNFGVTLKLQRNGDLS